MSTLLCKKSNHEDECPYGYSLCCRDCQDCDNIDGTCAEAKCTTCSSSCPFVVIDNE